jgi:uncharacterized membrane protein YeaQ/YmgE (transglycosylase-associated protein family)
MSIIAWIIFGGLAGWIASMITGDNARQGIVGNIIVGVLGAFIGGWLASYFGNGISGFNLGSLVIAILGAVVLLLMVKAFRRNSPDRL